MSAVGRTRASIRRPQASERNHVHIISHHVRNVYYCIVSQYGDTKRVRIAPLLWPSDMNGTRWCTVAISTTQG